MIYTVTLNPSLDYIIKCQMLNEGCVNKGHDEKFYAGGKGINVSIMLNNLGIENTAIGFVSGFTGDKFLKIIENYGIRNNFLLLNNGNTRVNVKIQGDKETEINGEGPFVSQDDFLKLLNIFDTFKKDDLVVLSGSAPKSDINGIYSLMAEKLYLGGVNFIADTTGNSLKNILKYKPVMVKPNINELNELFNLKINTIEEVLAYANKLNLLGAQNVIISMGEKGAVMTSLKCEKLIIKAPSGKKISTIGSGDSMVAGWIAGMILFNDSQKALSLAVSAGSASAFSEGIASKESVMKLYEKISNSI